MFWWGGRGFMFGCKAATLRRRGRKKMGLRAVVVTSGTPGLEKVARTGGSQQRHTRAASEQKASLDSVVLAVQQRTFGRRKVNRVRQGN